MKEMLLSLEFWVAIAVAVALKLKSSPSISIGGAIFTTLTALGSALVFTAPVMDALDLAEVYAPAVAALAALSAEHIARQLLSVTLVDLIALWRGKK